MTITLNSFQQHFSLGGRGEVRPLPLYLEKERLPRSQPGSAVPTHSALPSPWWGQRKQGLCWWYNNFFVSLPANITTKWTETLTATWRFLRDKKKHAKEKRSTLRRPVCQNWESICSLNDTGMTTPALQHWPLSCSRTRPRRSCPAAI